MKKLFCFLAFSAFALTSCNSDDDGGGNPIRVDGERLDHSVRLTYLTEEGGFTSRTFSFLTNDVVNPDSLTATVFFANGQADADGTYNVAEENAYGYFVTGDGTSYYFATGIIRVDEESDQRFEVEFYQVEATNSDNGQTIIIDGNYEGNFTTGFDT